VDLKRPDVKVITPVYPIASMPISPQLSGVANAAKKSPDRHQ
jgi:hypothetical protein